MPLRQLSRDAEQVHRFRSLELRARKMNVRAESIELVSEALSINKMVSGRERK